MEFWAVALDGWVGALASALVAAGVAWLVLTRTLRHDREAIADQLRKQREMAVWQRQLELFGDVTARLSQLSLVPSDRAELLRLTDDVRLAVHRWRMYTAPEDGTFPGDLEILTLRMTRIAWRTRRGVCDEAMEAGQRPPDRISVEVLVDLAPELALLGRAWHTSPERRVEAEEWARRHVAEQRPSVVDD